MLQLRINRQNLINEMKLNNGKTMTQFVLRKPRPLPSTQRKLPPMEDMDLKRRMLKMRRKNMAEGAMHEEDTILFPRRGSMIEQRIPAEPLDDGNKADPDEPDEDKKHGPAPLFDESEVTRVLESRLLSSIFRSMQHQDGSGLPRERVVRCLEVLGYKCLDAQLVEDCLKAIPGEEPLSLSQFAKLAVAFANHRRARFLERFRSLDYRKTGFVSVREFRTVLREFGFAMSPVAMAELLDEVGVCHQMQMDWGQFEAALSNVHERFGFTASEVAEMEAAFDKYDQRGSGVLGAEELAGVMGWLGHPQSIEQAQATLTLFDMDGDKVLDKLEFLLAVRQWQNEEVELANQLFSEFDSDADGLMTLQELVTLFEKLGYTVLPHVIEEGIRTVKAHAAGLMFEEVLHLLKKLRSQECFSDQERVEFMEVFRRFDRSGQGRLRQFELAPLLNWLGYQHSPSRRAELWIRVDTDKSGFLEQGEFLKLLRYLREEEASAAREILTEAGGEPLGRAEVLSFLHRLGYAPSEEILHDAMTLSLDQNENKPTTLLEALAVVQNVREMQAAKLRENHGLLDHVVNKINSRFARHFSTGRPVEPMELERLLHHLFPVVRHSNEDREHLRCFVAQQVSAEESPTSRLEKTVGRSSMLQGQKISSLSDLYALVSKYGEERDERAWQREADVIAALGFSAAQVAEIREVFLNVDENSNGYLDEDEFRVAFDEVFASKMVRNERILQMWSKPDSRPRCVDFPVFLQLVKMASL